MVRISKGGLLGVYISGLLTALVLIVAGMVALAHEHDAEIESVGGWLAVAGVLLLYLTGAAGMGYLIHRMWAALQFAKVDLTPGPAAGLYFVPFFNLYWVFRAIAGWAKDYNRVIAERRLDVPRMSEGLALAMSICIACRIVPYCGQLLVLPALVFVLIPIFMANVCNHVNALADALKQEAPGTPAAPAAAPAGIAPAPPAVPPAAAPAAPTPPAAPPAPVPAPAPAVASVPPAPAALPPPAPAAPPAPVAPTMIASMPGPATAPPPVATVSAPAPVPTPPAPVAPPPPAPPAAVVPVAPAPGPVAAPVAPVPFPASAAAVPAPAPTGPAVPPIPAVQPPPPPSSAQRPAETRLSALAVVSLIVSILGFCTAGLGGLVGMVLGLIACFRVRNPENRLRGLGLAVAAIVIGALAVLLGLIVGIGMLFYSLSYPISSH